MDYILTEEKIEIKLLSRLSRKRADHSRRTAVYARFLAARYKVNEEKAYLAGLCHDLAKEEKDREILRLAALYRAEDIFEDEKKLPLLLHGRAAAGLLIEEMDPIDDDILDAVTWHITGTTGMAPLAKVLYCADFLEPGRTFLTDDFRNQAVSGDLDSAVKAVITALLEHRKIKKHDPCRRERGLIEYYGLGGCL